MKKNSLFLSIVLSVLCGALMIGCNNKSKGSTRQLEGEVDSPNSNIDQLGDDVDELGTQVDNLGGSIDGLGDDVDALNSSVNDLNNSINNPPAPPGLPYLPFTIDIEDWNYSQSPVREVQNQWGQNLLVIKITASNQPEEIKELSFNFSKYLPAVEVFRLSDWQTVGYASSAGVTQTVTPIGTTLASIPQVGHETLVVRANLSHFDREAHLETLLTSVTTQDGYHDLVPFHLTDEVLVERGPKASVAPLNSSVYSLDNNGSTWQTINRFRVSDTGDTGLTLEQSQFVLDVPNADNVEIRIAETSGVQIGTAWIDSWQPVVNETIYWIDLESHGVQNLTGITLLVQVNVQSASLPTNFDSQVNWLWVKNPSNSTYGYATLRHPVTSSVTVTTP